MKALFLKDLYILKNTAKMVLAMIFMILFLLSASEAPWGQAGFVLGYGVFFSAILVLNTISYDDHNKGMSFLMTLPVSRSIYVKEKYVFGLLMGIAGWAISSLCVFGFLTVRKVDYEGKELLFLIAGFFLALLVILSLMLPVQLKFGGENGRIVLLLGILAGAGLVWTITKVGKGLHLDIQKLLAPVLGLGTVPLTGILVVLVLLLLAVSYGISLKVLQKKQF